MVQHSSIDHTGITGAGGSVATDAIFDAKGDLAAGTGANTAAKLTVGANDTILMADSGQSTGLKWVAAGTPTDQDYDDVAAAGTADTFARGDHLHGMPSAGGGGGSVVKAATPIHYTGGNVTVNSTTWSDLATYGPGAGAFDLDFTGCVAGDIVFVSISYQAQSDSEYILVTVATIVSASPVNYFGGRTGATSGSGVVCWQAITGREETPGGTAAYVVQSGDLSAGALKLRPYARIHSAGSRIMFGGASEPLHISAWLIRP